MVNSRTPTMKRRMNPAESAGNMSGISTRRSVTIQRAPEAAEASSSSLWICKKPARASRVVVAKR